MARVLIDNGWLPQFRVFNELQLHDGTAAEEESAWAGTGPGPEAEPGNVTAGTRGPPLPPAPASPPPLTLTTHSVSEDRYRGFYPAGTVSPADNTGQTYRMPLRLADVA